MAATRKTFLISAIFLLTDAALFYGLFYLAAALRHLLSSWLGSPLFWGMIESMARTGVALGIGTFLLQGLYPGYGLTAVKELEHMSRSSMLVFFLLAGVSYLGKSMQSFPRSVLLIAFGLALVALPLVRFVMRNLLSRTALYGVPVVIFGDGAWAEQIRASLRRARRLGWRVEQILPVQQVERLPEGLSSQVAILAPSFGDEIEDCARRLSLRFHKVVLVRQDDNFGSLWVEPRDLEGQLGLEFHYHLLDRRAIWLKRLVDILGSLALLVLLSPLLLLISVLIVLDSPGPILYGQRRIGQNFCEYRILKFRTMVKDADERLAALLAADPAARREYEQYHKLARDPRVTRLGKWLRRYSLDELPQLWNVLEGKMSLVGPRIGVPAELDDMGAYAPSILRVRPGMTGWWQVMRDDATTFEQRMKMDEHYISNWSLWMDIYILMKTIWVVLRGDGL